MLNALWLSFIESIVCLGLTVLAVRVVRMSATARASFWLAPGAVALIAFSASLAASLRPAPVASPAPIPFARAAAIGGDLPAIAAPLTLNAHVRADLTGDPRLRPRHVLGEATRVAAAWAQSHATFIIALWLAGALACFGQLSLRLACLARLRRHCRPLAPEAVLPALHALRIRAPLLGRLAQCDDLLTPAVLGLGQPVIALPPGFLSTTDPDDLAFVLAHETAHLVRHDAVIDIIVRAVEGLFWFNPALAIARRRLALERERACDELAAEWTCGRNAAARALWRTAVSLGIAPPIVLSVSGAPSQLAARIASLVAPGGRSPSAAAQRAIAVCVLAVAAAGGALASPGLDAQAQGRLEPIAPMAAARSDQVAVGLDDGEVLLAGGLVGSSETIAAAEVFDPATRSFHAVGSLHVARAGAAFARLPDGQVLVAGGWSSGGPTASAEIYDPARRAFRVIASMAGPRASGTTALLPDGRVLIAGGESSSQTALKTAEIFDPTRERFEPTGEMQNARTNAAAAALPGGRVLIAGGSDGLHALSSTEIYEPSQRRFLPASPLATAREKAGAASLADGRVLVVGGARDGSWRLQLATTEIYDPHTERFMAGPDMSEARFKLGAQVVQLPSGRVLITGGASRAEIFDPRTGKLALVPGTLGLARHYGTATLLTNGEVLIAGGYGNDVRHSASAMLYRLD